MPDPDRRLLLDLPPYPATGYAKLADRIAALIGTKNDVVFVQAEAVVALEAAATSLGAKGMTALNIVTSPYGELFGFWLRRAGADVIDLKAEPGLPVTVVAVAEALAGADRIDLVALVHAESASGILNPLPQIAKLAREKGALLLVDAVASAGGYELDVDALGIDIAIIGPQKALGGPASISAVSISARAWQAIDRPDAPRRSVLSLADIRHNWLDAGRGVLAGMPSALEFQALEAALDRVEAEGIAGTIARHLRAQRAARAGLVAVGARLWVEEERDASRLVTTILLPDGLDARKLAEDDAAVAAGLSAGIGCVASKLLRLDHTGRRASREAVLEGVRAVGRILDKAGVGTDAASADAAVAAAYAGQFGTGSGDTN
ncbi:pyridoxal-phosphate-dependent aminotransferase family protein (plasmid) [Aquamicrobium terrae]